MSLVLGVKAAAAQNKAPSPQRNSCDAQPKADGKVRSRRAVNLGLESAQKHDRVTQQKKAES
jgi:hypothetical protein